MVTQSKSTSRHVAFRFCTYNLLLTDILFRYIDIVVKASTQGKGMQREGSDKVCGAF